METQVQVIEVLKNMIKKYGIQILWGSRFFAIFSDLAPRLRREGEIFREIFNKELESFIKEACIDEKNQRLISQNLHQALKDKVGLTEQNANCVMNWYIFAAGWNLKGWFGEEMELEPKYPSDWSKYDLDSASWWDDSAVNDYPKLKKKGDQIVGYCWNEQEYYEGKLVKFFDHYVTDGKGRLVTSEGIYEGIFIFPYGIEEKNWSCEHGWFFCIDHSVYEGKFINGKCEGYGKYVSPCTGVTYEGDFENGKFHGQGERKFRNGTVEHGRFSKGKFIEATKEDIS